MDLHTLTSKPRKYGQRIGRGGKRGTTSGRGQKGQKSRSGHKIRPALRDLISRLPKRRGFKNKIKASKPHVVNLASIMRHIKKHGGEAVVSAKSLREWGVISIRYTGPIKLLASGMITTPITVRGLAVSDAAKAKIEKAGGKVEEKAARKTPVSSK